VSPGGQKMAGNLIKSGAEILEWRQKFKKGGELKIASKKLG
jgi:hypothetical protein